MIGLQSPEPELNLQLHLVLVPRALVASICPPAALTRTICRDCRVRSQMNSEELAQSPRLSSPTVPRLGQRERVGLMRRPTRNWISTSRTIGASDQILCLISACGGKPNCTPV